MLIAKKDIRNSLSVIPESPGVYIYRDKEDKVLYVGKAKNLRKRVGETPLRHPQRLREVILRPRITLDGLVPFVPQLANFLKQGQLAEEVKETIEVEVKYAGYIARERQVAEKSRHLEDIRIDGHFDYLSIQSLSTEARQKLDRIRPATIGQASRIPGISPSDINILLILMGR